MGSQTLHISFNEDEYRRIWYDSKHKSDSNYKKFLIHQIYFVLVVLCLTIGVAGLGLLISSIVLKILGLAISLYPLYYIIKIIIAISNIGKDNYDKYTKYLEKFIHSKRMIRDMRYEFDDSEISYYEYTKKCFTVAWKNIEEIDVNDSFISLVFGPDMQTIWIARTTTIPEELHAFEKKVMELAKMKGFKII